MSVQELKQKIEAKKAGRKTKDFEFVGEKVIIRQISGMGFAEWREYANSDDPKIHRLERAKLAQLCLHDPESGQRIYDDNEVTQIIGHNAIEIDRVYNECLRVNGYGDAGREDVLKNLLMTLGENGLLELREIIDARLQSCSPVTPSTN
jgi:hypothetical protein